MAAGPLIELRDLNKSYGAVQVLKSVSLTVRAGEVTALVGDNGAGKSTLVNCIGGILPVEDGTFLIDGAPVTLANPREARDLGVETVHQDLALCDNLDVVQNMFLGREVSDGMRLDEITMERKAAETLRQLGIHTIRSLRQPVATLSGGQRKSVAIARAVLWHSRVLILDEPTAALGVTQTRQVLEYGRHLADRGVAVLLVSHNLNDVFAVADSIAALYLGTMAAQVRAADITYAQVVELIMTGQCDTLGHCPVPTDTFTRGPSVAVGASA
ncbi:MAG TPA: ATP-binding cassette domain-containing protein [Micromonosporaceae bacterium]